MRTLRSNDKRFAIWQAQAGICAICGKRMDAEDWEIDHKKPYSKGGETERFNEQAVHKLCNRRKGVSEPILKVIKLLSDNRRPQIFWAINKVVENWTNDLPSTSCCIPPRFGKSDVIRGSALELQEIGAPPSIVVAPWDFLVNQIKDEKKYNEMRARFDIPREAKFATFRRESKLTTDRWWQLEAGAPTLISMTIG